MAATIKAKHYDELARIMGSVVPDRKMSDAITVGVIMEWLEDIDPKFDREKFVRQVIRWADK